jgi:bifunctional UDP-N-acetylglucosamine pyrophosphorylase/glucosamine-1-phosphate N-acetyltransferase
MTAPFNIVVLAAGRGTRMVSDLPKVLHPLAGKSLLAHVLDSARQLDPLQICVVYGYGGDAVPNAIADTTIAWALQAEQLGTGHALMQALPHLADSGVTLILYGDVPLTQLETLR